VAITDRHSVTAIVVTHDGETWLPAVVAALASQTRPADQIVAVDTDSNDSSTKLIKAARIPLIAEIQMIHPQNLLKLPAFH